MTTATRSIQDRPLRGLAQPERTPLMRGAARTMLWLLAAAIAQWSRLWARPSAARHILVVSPTYFAQDSIIGGGERYPVELARALAKHRRVVFAGFGPTPFRRVHDAVEFRIYRPQVRLGGSLFHVFHLSLVRDIWEADVVHCSQFRTATTAIALLIAKLFGKRTVVTDYGYGSTNSTANVLVPLVDRFAMISAFAATMIAAPAAKKHVVFGGVDIDRFTPIAFALKEPYVLFVGRILPHKGIDVLLRAVTDQQVVIMGRKYDEAYFADLQTLARGKNVRFIHDVADAGLVSAMQRAAVLVLPSRYQDLYGKRHPQPELLGLVLLEAMACGTPVIASDVGAMPEIVESGKSGFIVRSGDVADLGSALEGLLSDPEARHELGRYARHTVERNYSWDRIAARYVEVYTS